MVLDEGFDPGIDAVAGEFQQIKMPYDLRRGEDGANGSDPEAIFLRQHAIPAHHIGNAQQHGPDFLEVLDNVGYVDVAGVAGVLAQLLLDFLAVVRRDLGGQGTFEFHDAVCLSIWSIARSKHFSKRSVSS